MIILRIPAFKCIGVCTNKYIFYLLFFYVRRGKVKKLRSVYNLSIFFIKKISLQLQPGEEFYNRQFTKAFNFAFIEWASVSSIPGAFVFDDSFSRRRWVLCALTRVFWRRWGNMIPRFPSRLGKLSTN